MQQGYRGDSTDRVSKVFGWDQPVAEKASDQAIAERAFQLLNVGDTSYGSAYPLAIDYRSRSLRPTSVGDLIAIDGRYYACADPRTWTLVAQPHLGGRPEPGRHTRLLTFAAFGGILIAILTPLVNSRLGSAEHAAVWWLAAAVALVVAVTSWRVAATYQRSPWPERSRSHPRHASSLPR